MSGASMRNRDRILEAIDQLRHRKARPDIQRICGYLFRRFHINSAEAKSDLEWCVANNIVLKVEYKGSISYRNAAKKLAQSRHRENHVYNGGGGLATSVTSVSPNQLNKLALSKNFTELLTNVFGELIVEEPDYLELGVPARELIDNILSKDSVRYTRNYIAILLIKEAEKGNLVKLENGNFLIGIGPCAIDRRKEKVEKVTIDATSLAAASAMTGEVAERVEQNTKKEEPKQNVGEFRAKKRHFSKIVRPVATVQLKTVASMENSSDEKRSDSANVRLGGRRKKAKKVFDPSDTHIPKKRGRPAGSLNKSTIEKQLAKSNDDSRSDTRSPMGIKDHSGVCSVCHVQNKRGPNDRMVACRECSNKAHFSCLNGEDMMLKLYPDNTWQCPHCKTCVICYETSDAGNLTVCSVCADGYHASCHQPRIADKIKNGQKWLCINCQMPDELKVNEIQSNIGDSFNHKIINELRSGEQSPSNCHSGNNSISSESNSPMPSPTPPRLSPQTNRTETPDRDTHSDSQSNRDSEPEDPNIDPSIPDATHWTADEVYQYFAKYFPDEAKIFKEQEIDGRSLLLLKRMDVLTNLNLKLGPALKIYRHVVMLQVRRDDRSLYWL